jgi:hypothetical protein
MTGQLNLLDVPTPRNRRMNRKSFNDAVEALLRAHEGEWVDSTELMKAGGSMAWRTRISNLRTLRGLVIRNEQRRIRRPDGTEYTQSLCRLVPKERAA